MVVTADILHIALGNQDSKSRLHSGIADLPIAFMDCNSWMLLNIVTRANVKDGLRGYMSLGTHVSCECTAVALLTCLWQAELHARVEGTMQT